MKRSKILQAATAIVLISLVSCAPRYHSESYSNAPAVHSFSLIINPYPGIAVSRYHDGRYYYRSPQGYVYWRGYDNRYYLDRKYVGNGYRHDRYYNEWKRYGRRRGR